MPFRHKKRVNDTELSKYIWKLKEENADYNLQWSIKAYASPYKYRTRKCDLCLTEKMVIARPDPKKLLNKRETWFLSLDKKQISTVLHQIRDVAPQLSRTQSWDPKFSICFLVSWWSPAYLWCNIYCQRTTLKLLMQHSLSVYLRNFQEKICVMNLIHIFTVWWLWIHMKLLVAEMSI